MSGERDIILLEHKSVDGRNDRGTQLTSAKLSSRSMEQMVKGQNLDPLSAEKCYIIYISTDSSDVSIVYTNTEYVVKS